MNKLTILGVFFDGYRDLWLDFVTLFKKNWPDCPFDLYIISNTDIEESFHGVRVINAGKTSEYSFKIKKALETIESDYYLVLLEDFFLGSKIDNEKVESILDYIESSGIKYYSMPMREFSNNYKGTKIKNRPFERLISPNAIYTLSCQPSIWEASFLKKCIGKENYNAWIFEGVYSQYKVAHTSSFLSKCVVNTSNPLNIKHGALQGKMVLSTYRYFIKSGYRFSSNRQLMSKKESFKKSMITNLRGLMPYWMQKTVKKVFKTKGVTSKYDEEIKRVITSLEKEQ